jgi:hypothetical protein
MNTLLELALTAHGGLKRWQEIKNIRAKASITGATWYIKNRPDVLKNVEIDVETKSEKLTMSFIGEPKQTVFEGSIITIKRDKQPPEIWQNSVKSFEGHTLETPWNDIHVAYFSGEALWTYLNIPFIYAHPDFEIEEISPW